MRILTTADVLSFRGGLERIHLDVMRRLAQRGHEVDLLFAEDDDASERWFEFVARAQRSRPSVRGSLGPFLRALPRLARGVWFGARGRPDVVYVPRHTHLPVALGVGTLVRTPVVCHVHAPPPRPVFGLRHRVGFRRVERVVAVSHFTARQWRDAGLPAPVDVVPNGVDAEAFRPLPDGERRAVRQRLGIGSGEFVVLYAGRLDPVKGIDTLLDAWRILTANGLRGRLLLVGAPSAYLGRRGAELLASWRARSDPSTTLFLGHVPDPAALYAAADVVAVPSEWAEPCPLVPLEAMACGTPVVAARTGGIPELLEPGFSGHLVEPGDPEALAGALGALRDWRRRDPSLGDRCRRYVLARFTVERMVEDVEAILLAAAARWGRAASPRPAQPAPDLTRGGRRP